MIQEEGADSAPHQLLRELYKIAIEEYRFNVNQNADRQKFFVGLNVAPSICTLGQGNRSWETGA